MWHDLVEQGCQPPLLRLPDLPPPLQLSVQLHEVFLNVGPGGSLATHAPDGGKIASAHSEMRNSQIFIKIFMTFSPRLLYVQYFFFIKIMAIDHLLHTIKKGSKIDEKKINLISKGWTKYERKNRKEMNDKLAKKTVKKFSSFSQQGGGTKKLKKMDITRMCIYGCLDAWKGYCFWYHQHPRRQ